MEKHAEEIVHDLHQMCSALEFKCETKCRNNSDTNDHKTIFLRLLMYLLILKVVFHLWYMINYFKTEFCIFVQKCITMKYANSTGTWRLLII